MDLGTDTTRYRGEGARVPLGRCLQPVPWPWCVRWPAAHCHGNLSCWKMQRGLGRVQATAFEGDTDPRSRVCGRTE